MDIKDADDLGPQFPVWIRAEQAILTAIGRAGHHEIFWPPMNIKMNATADPLLETPRFAELRERIRGD